MADHLTRRDFLKLFVMSTGMVIGAKSGIDRVQAFQYAVADSRAVGNQVVLSNTRRTVCSCYGPGFYGRTTACGQTLRRDTIGVAHRSLRCDTRLKFRGKDGWVHARVIDRGPHVAGREFDLTEGLVKRMGYDNCSDFGVRTVRWDYA